MPVVPFDALPDDARVWVFASESPLKGGSAHRLLDEVDQYLAQWRANFEELKVKRDGLAAELRRDYPPIEKIADLLARIAANDDEIVRLHVARPSGVALHLAALRK